MSGREFVLPERNYDDRALPLGTCCRVCTMDYKTKREQHSSNTTRNSYLDILQRFVGLFSVLPCLSDSRQQTLAVIGPEVFSTVTMRYLSLSVIIG